MQGRLVALRWPVGDDFALIADWVRPLSPTAVLAADSEMITADEVRELNRRGTVQHLMVIRDDQPIGVVSWRPVGAPGGYSIGSAVGDSTLWNRGYGAEATALLVDYLFHVRNAYRIQVTTALFNKHSVQVMTRGHFVLEGILRHYHFLDGQYHDAAIWSMLRDEYYAGVEVGKAINPDFDVQDLVPEQDKADARRMLARYLDKDLPTSLRAYRTTAGSAAPAAEARS